MVTKDEPPSSEEISAEDSIASCGLACQMLFRRCLESPETLENAPNLSLKSTLLVHSKRYNLWAKNIAAHHDGRLPSSLEYRIRDDENACRIVKKALNYLTESLELILTILTGEKENEKWESISELEELDLAVQEGVTHLFELSMIIRKKPEKDEYIKASLATSFDPTPDIVHVGDKYPLTRDNVWLKERLGTAITRRRQYLRYRRGHQEKMEQIHELRKNADGKTVWSGEKASTYLQESVFGKTIPTPIPVEMSPTGTGKRPQTEYADSSRGKDGATDLLRTPLLPKDSRGVRVEYGQYFECPYCWRPQNVRDKNEWKKHIFSDLRPYICTFQGCGLNMFESQNQWFSHEVRFHRKLWRCTLCEDTNPRSRADLEVHMNEIHVDVVQETNMEVLLETSVINRIDATCCSLCTAYGSRLQSINQSSKCDVSLKQFQEHLGRHMEQLALAALPAEDTEEDEIDDEDERRVTDRTVHASSVARQMSQLVVNRGGFGTAHQASYALDEPSLERAPIRGTRRPSWSITDVKDEKKPGILNTVFRRTRKDKFDDSDFKRGKALDFPEIPGEETRAPNLKAIGSRYSRGEVGEVSDKGRHGESHVIADSGASIHSVSSSASSSARTRASNIVQIAYIPGVTNRDRSASVTTTPAMETSATEEDRDKPLPQLPPSAVPASSSSGGNKHEDSMLRDRPGSKHVWGWQTPDDAS